MKPGDNVGEAELVISMPLEMRVWNRSPERVRFAGDAQQPETVWVDRAVGANTYLAARSTLFFTEESIQFMEKNK